MEVSAEILASVGGLARLMASQSFLPPGIGMLSRDFLVSVLGRLWREGCGRALVSGEGLDPTPGIALERADSQDDVRCLKNASLELELGRALAWQREALGSSQHPTNQRWWHTLAS